MLDGLLIVDKQKGWTSYDVVAFLRRAFKQKKIGHAGTLDPLATGVLVVAFGKAARVIEFLTADEKEYETVVCLGKTTTTHDAEGDITPVSDRQPSREEILQVLETLTGHITQIPPIYSAIRIGGERAYDLARKGKEVDIPSRVVEIKELTLLSYDYPYVTLKVVCSKGTYIRTLGSDLGGALGTGGYLTSLRRTRSGAFDLSKAVPFYKEIPHEDIIKAIIPLPQIKLTLPEYQLSDEEAIEIFHGRRVPNTKAYGEGEVVSLISQKSELLGVAKIQGAQICVYKNFM